MTEILELMLLLTVGLMVGFVVGSLATSQYTAGIDRRDERNRTIGYRRSTEDSSKKIVDIIKSM